MNLFDQLIAASLPIVPKPVVGLFSRRYIAGETLDDVVRVVRELNGEGAMATVDVLGEDTLEASQARETVTEYERLIDAIGEHELDCNISIKLTAFGLLIDPSLCRDNVRSILDRAKAAGMFVRIDMEDSGVTTKTLDLYRDLREEYEGVGPVLQAYLRRTLADVRSLLEGQPLNVRLCKGIYDEPADLAFKNREVIRRSYTNLLEVLLRAGAYVGIATHDEPLLYDGLRLIDELGLDRSQYEFQMLLGVIPEIRRVLIRDGHPLRVYVPYGAHWYGYSKRRLRENPRIAGYVLKSMLSGR